MRFSDTCKSHDVSCSRGMAGTLTSEVLDVRPDENGTFFKDAAQHAGYGASSHKVHQYSAQVLALCSIRCDCSSSPSSKLIVAKMRCFSGHTGHSYIRLCLHARSQCLLHLLGGKCLLITCWHQVVGEASKHFETVTY